MVRSFAACTLINPYNNNNALHNYRSLFCCLREFFIWHRQYYVSSISIYKVQVYQLYSNIQPVSSSVVTTVFCITVTRCFFFIVRRTECLPCHVWKWGSCVKRRIVLFESSYSFVQSANGTSHCHNRRCVKVPRLYRDKCMSVAMAKTTQ